MVGPAERIGIGPVMGLLLVATTMIGSGIFLLPATLATVGSISVSGWLLAAAGAVLVGLALAGLAGIALARVRTAATRWVAIACALFSWGFVLVQGAAMLAMAGASIAAMVLLILMGMHAQRRKAPVVPM
jgi:hypothetical protein